jgi:hypothetical protein
VAVGEPAHPGVLGVDLDLQQRRQRVDDLGHAGEVCGLRELAALRGGLRIGDEPVDRAVQRYRPAGR